jgi:hypothetical protein
MAGAAIINVEMTCGIKWGWVFRYYRESVFLEVTDDVHFFVGNTDDIDSVAANHIKDHMLAFGKAVVPLANIRSVLAQLRDFSKPVKASINTF